MKDTGLLEPCAMKVARTVLRGGGSWRHDAPTRCDLGDIAQRLNRHLVSRSRLGKFVTLVFAVLAEDGALTYVNAGHNPPLLVTDRGEVRRLTPGGTILGMLEDVRYKSAQEQIGPQDVLVLYSDGVTEARNSPQLFYSIERLERLVVQHRDQSAREIHDAIFDDWKTFTEGAPAADDVTVMVVKRRLLRRSPAIDHQFRPRHE